MKCMEKEIFDLNITCNKCGCQTNIRDEEYFGVVCHRCGNYVSSEIGISFDKIKNIVNNNKKKKEKLAEEFRKKIIDKMKRRDGFYGD